MRFLSPGKKTFYPVQWLFGLISRITPFFRQKQEKPVLVFSAFHGDAYRGNTRVLFENLQSCPDYRSVWLTRNPDLLAEMSHRFTPGAAVLLHSREGLRLLRDASMVLYTHGRSDFPFMHIPGECIQVHTYHGLPTKRGEYMKTDGSDTPPSFLHRKILEYRFAGINYFLSTSPFVSTLFAKRFNLRADQFAETGFPSLDELISSNSGKSDTCFTVLYAPTYRRRTRTRWFPFRDIEWTALHAFLEELDITLILRPHPNEVDALESYVRASERIILADATPLNEILCKTDAVVTDYSGIYLEALLKDIPAVFIPYDKNEYERGLPFDYEEMTPGPKVYSMKEFMMALEDALLRRAPAYAKKRDEVKKLFFSQADGKSTERTISFIKSLVPQR